MATGGVLLGDIRAALIPLLRGIVLRGDTRDPLPLTEPAIAHSHPEADPVDTPLITPVMIMIHVADLSRLVDTCRTLADRGALGVIPVAAADLQAGTSLETTTHPALRPSFLAQDPAPILDHLLHLSLFHHPPMHLQGLIDHQLYYLLVTDVASLAALLP
jgi:hypothetical protein